MTELWKDLREIDRRGWLALAMVATGNAILLIGGLEGSAALSLAILAALGIVWVFLLQFTRVIMQSSLELAQESTKEWQAEADFTQELLDDYVRTISDLKRYDVQASGIHLERLRRTLIKRRPELEDEIMQVEHPLNMTGLII